MAAMADLMTSQEDASAALAEGFREFEEIEKEIASELGVTVEELEEAEDYDLEARHRRASSGASPTRPERPHLPALSASEASSLLGRTRLLTAPHYRTRPCGSIRRNT